MSTAIDMRKFFLGTVAVGGVAVGFTIGLNRGQKNAYSEAKEHYEPLIEQRDEDFRSLTQSGEKRNGITVSSQSWMPLRFRFSDLDEILTEASAAEAPKAILARIQSLPKEEIVATLRELHKVERDDADFLSNFAEHALLLRLAELDSEAALAFAENTAPSRRNASRAAVLAVIAETDTAKAAIAALDEANTKRKNLFARRDATSAVAGNWAKQDPQSAVDWATSLPDTHLQTGAAVSAVYEAPHDQWSDLVSSIDDPFVHDYVAGGAAYRWSLSDPQAAVDWAYSVPVQSPGHYRSDPVVPALRGWWRQYPNRTASYLRNLPRNTRRNRDICRHAIPELFQEWLITDPAAALEYVSHLPDCAFRNEALAHIEKAFIIVINLDKLDLPEGATRAETLAAIAGKVNPDAVKAWVASGDSFETFFAGQEVNTDAPSAIIEEAKAWLSEAKENEVLTEADFQALEEQAAAEADAKQQAAEEAQAAMKEAEAAKNSD